VSAVLALWQPRWPKVVAKGATLGATNAAMGATSIAKSTGAALLGAGQIASHATGNLLQRVNHTLMKGHSMDIPGSDEMDVDPVNKANEEQRQFEEELERRYAEKLAEQLRARDRSLGVSAISAARTSVTVDEGNSKLAPPQIYHKLEMETDSHPFFKRVWNICHRLNEESPLLSRTARKMIAENGGYWPEELNNHKSIRKHLQFTEIIVNFSGTTNVSGSSVFAVHVYDFSNVNVGYSFVSTLARTEDGRLIADLELINDVVEQRGGGAEPLRSVVDEEKIKAVLEAFQAGSTSPSTRVINATSKAAAVFKSKLHNKDETPHGNESMPKPGSDSMPIDVTNGSLLVPTGAPSTDFAADAT